MRNIFLFCLFLCHFPVYAQFADIGDLILNADGSKGIVFWLNPDRSGGWMIALDDCGTAFWGQKGISIPELKYNMDTAGYKKTGILRAHQGKGERYAAQLVDYENGWYLPTGGQIRKLQWTWVLVRKAILENGGSDMQGIYCTCEESLDKGLLFSIGGNYSIDYINCKNEDKEKEKFAVRPIRTFQNTNFSYRWSTGETTAAISVVPRQTTDYTVTITSAEGWVTTASKRIVVNPTFLIEREAAITEGEQYDFRGRLLTKPGVYYDSLRTERGCDSVICLKLAVNTFYLFEEEREICWGERYLFRGRELTEPGVYNDSLKTLGGADSIYRLHLSVHPTWFSLENAGICAGETYDFRGMKISQPGIYYDTLRTIKGCDSIFGLELSVRPSYERWHDAVICQGERYTENGFDETVSGEYPHLFSSVSGCDSLVGLRLQVLDTFAGDIKVVLADCRTHEYRFRASDPLAGFDFRWEFGGEGSTLEEMPVYSYADSGTYEVKLRTSVQGKCERTKGVQVMVPWYPQELKISSNPAVINRYTEVELSTACVPGMDYHWQTGDGTESEECRFKHTYLPDMESQYVVRLKLTNSDDCVAEAEFILPVLPDTKAVNTFSPNGDGVNDIFRKGFHLKIIDRNGRVIFEGDDGWDGTRDGKTVPQGVYFYEILSPGSSGIDRNGYVTLLRE